MARYTKRKSYRPKRKMGNTKHDKLVKMTGGVVDKALKYAGSIPGPIGTIANGLALVKNLINVECKTFDVTVVSSQEVRNSATYYSQDLNNLAKGTGDADRIGNSVLGNKLMIKLLAVRGASATVNQTIRIALVYDKKPDIGTMTYNTIFGSTDLNAFNDPNNSDRYVKLWDMKFTLTSNAPVRNLQKMVNLARIHTKWDDSNNFEKGRLTIVACTDASINYPTMGFTSRYCFFDN